MLKRFRRAENVSRGGHFGSGWEHEEPYASYFLNNPGYGDHAGSGLH